MEEAEGEGEGEGEGGVEGEGEGGVEGPCAAMDVDCDVDGDVDGDVDRAGAEVTVSIGAVHITSPPLPSLPSSLPQVLTQPVPR